MFLFQDVGTPNTENDISKVEYDVVVKNPSESKKFNKNKGGQGKSKDKPK